MASLNGPLSVLFLSGEARETDGSRIYRCVFKAKEVAQSGARTRVMFCGDAGPTDLAAADVVIFSRCTWQPHTLDLIAHARGAGKLICGDLDDRIFAPWEAQNTGYLRTKALTNEHALAMTHILETQRNTLRLLPAFDQVLVSTPRLKQELEGLGISATVSRNAIDASVHPPIAKAPERLARLLFMTGTRTHDADFRVMAPALWAFLAEHPEVELTLLGPLTPPVEARRFPRVRSVGRLPMSQLHTFVASHDLCLVPLEETVFNDCKSALKFLECGLVSVPIIASPREEFCSIVRDGDNGLLARTLDDWYRALCRLYDEPERLQRLARNAHASVLAQHTVQSRGRELADDLTRLISERHKRSTPPTPRPA